MNCPYCGTAITAQAAQCAKCGTVLSQAPVATAEQPPQRAQPVGYQLVDYALKSKIAAGLLGIFLGALGIHRFYLGYTGIGLTQLLLTVVGGPLTCGFSPVAVGIWGLVEGILILTGNMKDAQGRPLRD